MEDEKTFNKRRSLKKRFDRWRSGEDLPTLFDLHNFVDQAATEVDWLDNPQEWKARFTLAHAMQNACDEMDELFKDIYVYVDSSLKLTKMIKQVSEEGIVCDDEKVLADPYRFFAARLWQLKVKQDGNWEKLVAGTPESKPGSFPKFSSVEEDERYRKKMLREMNPGNRFLQAIMKMSTSDGCLRSNDFSAQNFIALDKYLFELGVHELNRIIKKMRKGAGKR